MWRSKESVVYLRKQKMIKNMNTTQTQQTAVEWLEDNIQSDMTFNDINRYIAKAKEMDKEQRKQIYDNGYANGQMDLINQ